MTLSTRLSAFFLAALALVVAGFSGTLYILAHSYLMGQLDERLLRSLDTLEASVDIEPGGLEWEPADRQLRLGGEPGPGGVRWVVRDSDGVLVDHSANVSLDDFPAGWTPSSWPSIPGDGSVFGAAGGWRLAARRLHLDDLLKRGRGHPNDRPGYEVQYRVLVLLAGLSSAWPSRVGSPRPSAEPWTSAPEPGRVVCSTSGSPRRSLPQPTLRPRRPEVHHAASRRHPEPSPEQRP